MKPTSGLQRGATGFFRGNIPASLGNLLPFFVLHLMHDVTTFSQLVAPPLSLGMTWSKFNSRESNFLWQYWHKCSSLWKIFSLENFTSFLGSLSKAARTIIEGKQKQEDTVLTTGQSSGRSSRLSHDSKSWVENCSSPKVPTAWAWPKKRRPMALRAEHKLMGCQRRFSTSTCLSIELFTSK